MAWSLPKNLKPILLLVEGKDECNFFEAFCDHLSFKDIQAIDMGKTTFEDRFRLLKKHSDWENILSIGIVRDADNSAKSAFESICRVLTVLNLPTPNQEILPTSKSPHISILIMPPNQEGSGRMLEDLFVEVIKDDPAITCSDDYLQCIEASGITIEPHHLIKAKARFFLASRPQEDILSIGLWAKKFQTEWEHPAFAPVKDFLNQLIDMKA
jgi:hypothetical protein